MISELNYLHSIYHCSDMICYPNKMLPFYFCPFYYDQLKHVREYETLYPYLNYNKTKNNTVESGNENDYDAKESISKSNNDAVESESYNGVYESKDDFLFHLNQHNIDCNGKM